jgi:hypothetical protein
VRTEVITAELGSECDITRRAWHDSPVYVVLILAFIAILVGVFAVATGRGGELAYEQADHAPLDLGPVSATDVALLRPPTALWGYNMQVTDEALDRIARALRDRDVEIAYLQRQLADVGHPQWTDQSRPDPWFPPATQAPGPQAPETQTPETHTPETQTPETQTPETQTPETPVSESEEPQTQEFAKLDPRELGAQETQETEETEETQETEEQGW